MQKKLLQILNLSGLYNKSHKEPISATMNIGRAMGQSAASATRGSLDGSYAESDQIYQYNG